MRCRASARLLLTLRQPCGCSAAPSLSGGTSGVAWCCGGVAVAARSGVADTCAAGVLKCSSASSVASSSISAAQLAGLPGAAPSPSLCTWQCSSDDDHVAAKLYGSLKQSPVKQKLFSCASDVWGHHPLAPSSAGTEC